jgi:hypothetical protein
MIGASIFTHIKLLQPSFPELGRIKIGMLGPERTSSKGNKYRTPEKLDHFRVTQRVRDAQGQFALDEEVHKLVGEKPTELNVTLLYDDPTLNCPSRLACYVGTRRWCHGDGGTALRLDAAGIYREQACPCPLLLSPETAPENAGKQDPNYHLKCKPNGSLSVQLPYKQSSVGVYRFRTTSVESIQSILTVQGAILMRTGGVLGGIPLRLRLYPATDNTPGGASKSWKVTLDLPPGGWAEVDEAAREIVRNRSASRLGMKAIEADARRQMRALGAGTVEADKLIDELFPRPMTEVNGVEVLDDEPEASEAETPQPDETAPETWDRLADPAEQAKALGTEPAAEPPANAQTGLPWDAPASVIPHEEHRPTPPVSDIEAAWIGVQELCEGKGLEYEAEAKAWRDKHMPNLKLAELSVLQVQAMRAWCSTLEAKKK